MFWGDYGGQGGIYLHMSGVLGIVFPGLCLSLGSSVVFSGSSSVADLVGLSVSLFPGASAFSSELFK